MTPTDPHRIVLCDDQPDFVRLLQLLLAIEGDLEVVGTAANGEEAIEVCGQLRPDLLVLDISMPVMDGLTALPLVRAASPDTNVVMLTGLGSSEVRERALAAGATGFIEKGASATELPELIRAACN
ncbi:MAG: two-component response regulator [Thermoleophilia bacterium]|nr:two-component response regulator [Thermoleophilia bacterium]